MNRCPYHDDTVLAIGSLVSQVDSVEDKIDLIGDRIGKIETILIGNGHEGLLRKVKGLSVRVGIGTTLLTLIITALIAAIVQHII